MMPSSKKTAGARQKIVVAIRLHQSSRSQRLGAARAAFQYARRAGIDELYLQPAFMERPPPGIAQAVERLVEQGRRQGRSVIVERPSNDDIKTALSATPFLESVNLVAKRRAIVTIADGADTLSLEVPRAGWEALRAQLEKAAGGTLVYDVEELRS